METPKITRTLIHIVSKYSNWQPSEIEATFRNNNIYANKNAWEKFIKIFLMSLGIAFLVSGIIFFFAYNWASLHKFVKLGLVQGLIIVMVAFAVFGKFDEKIKNTILMGAGMLVGALFAVFGQIYQTGANAYDFFLGWTIFVLLWVMASNFSPIWMLFLVLINVTIWQYFDQVLGHEMMPYLFILLFVINMLYWGVLEISFHFKKIPEVPLWMERTIVLFSVGYLTISFFHWIFDGGISKGLLTLILGLAFYPLGIYFGRKKKDTFYIATIGFSVILIGVALLTKFIDKGGDGIAVFFITGMFLIASVTALVFLIINLNKTWYGINE